MYASAGASATVDPLEEQAAIVSTSAPIPKADSLLKIFMPRASSLGAVRAREVPREQRFGGFRETSAAAPPWFLESLPEPSPVNPANPMHPTHTTLLSTLLLALPVAPPVASPVASQAGGFQPGDLYLYNPSYPVPGSSSGAIVRIEPATGAKTVLIDLVTSSVGADQMAYDPWRDRLIFFGGLVPNHNEVYLCDAAGNLESLGQGAVAGPVVGKFAPRGDGIIYFKSIDAPTLLSYFDAANQVQTLMDATGAAPFAFPAGAGAIRHLEYHAPSNRLVATTFSNLAVCPGGLADAVNIHLLDLSADGSRVVASSCFQFDLNPGVFGEIPAGLGPGPGGDLILHIDDNGPSALPRIVRVSPGTASAVSFATTATPATSSGCYSQLLGRAIVHDSSADELRAYSFGESGDGTTVTSGLGPATVAALVEIVPATSSFGLSAAPSSLSLAVGGAQTWAIDFGPGHAGELHLVAGSLSGWTPATPLGGVAVPLVLDGYTLWTLANQNGPLLVGTFGVLDGQGSASASFVLPAGTDPGLAGLTLYHAALSLNASGFATAATNPVALTLAP